MSVKLEQVLCMVAAVLAAVLAAPAEEAARRIKWQEHLVRVDQFHCGPPQPRLLPATEVLSSVQETNEIYHPAVTVLHRCDAASGCCNVGRDDETCGPKEQEEVELVFSVTRHTTWDRYETVRAINHTLCGCISNSVSGPK